MNQQRFETLRKKYEPALKVVEAEGIRLEHLHEENGKLVVSGRAPSEQAKNRVWDKIKQIDPAYIDLIADLKIDSGLMQPRRESPPLQEETDTYTVKAGDTLSTISKRHYGDANLYMQIFDSNRDVLRDPNHIEPGMRLRLPKRK